MVMVENLIKIFGEQRAVDGISFEASKGQITGFLGPNGAGKSTTMKIATGYIPPSSGTIHICGFDVMTHPSEVRSRVGYLPEHNPLYLDMYVKEYLDFSGAMYGMKGAVLAKRIEEMLDLVGLRVEMKKKIGALSKGYRQRVGLAQAILHNPEVLILDEPTTGLDPNQILEIRSVIKEIGKEKTVIFSTHIMQEVQALCDKVIIINKGKIVANDNVEALKKYTNKERVLTAEFQSEIDLSILQQLNHVREVRYLGYNRYEITCGTEHDLRADIFKLASEKGLTLLELNQVERSLENVFRDLTGDKA